MKTLGITRNGLVFGVVCLISIMQMEAEPGWAPWDIQAQSSQLLLKSDYKGLDALAAALNAKGYDIRQDKTEIDAFYEGFKVPDKENDQSWQNRLQLLEQWVSADSDSLSAHIAVALWHTDFGWRAAGPWTGSGPGISNTVSAKGLAILDSSARSAAESLRSVPSSTPVDDPVYYQVWLKICLMQGRPKEEMFRYLNECIAMEKEYEPIYLDAGNFLSERWYGEHDEREKWMKTWADSFPPEKGDILYSFLLSSEARSLGEDTFKLNVDYDRARNALEKRIAGDDPEWFHDENVLCYLAVVNDDTPFAKKMLFDLEGTANAGFYSDGSDDGIGEKYYRYLRGHYGVDQGFEQALDLERSGNLAEAEKLLRSFTFHPLIYLPLACFYERQGMMDRLLAMDYMILGKSLKEMARTDIFSAPPEYLAELASYYPMMGDWEKAEATARQFDQPRPMNLIGKNILLLCAIRRHDAHGERVALREIVNLKTDRPVYLAA